MEKRDVSIPYCDYFKRVSYAMLNYAFTVKDNKYRVTHQRIGLSLLRAALMRARRYRVFIIGNGGSASIASHVAVDFVKCLGLRATVLNDSAMLTCFANDCGYSNVFTRQLDAAASKGDYVIAISSSGESDNIISAAKRARQLGCSVTTFTGMSPNNRLRKLGDFNFHVASKSYGVIEVAHLALLHSLVSKDD